MGLKRWPGLWILGRNVTNYNLVISYTSQAFQCNWKQVICMQSYSQHYEQMPSLCLLKHRREFLLSWGNFLSMGHHQSCTQIKDTSSKLLCLHRPCKHLVLASHEPQHTIHKETDWLNVSIDPWCSWWGCMSSVKRNGNKCCLYCYMPTALLCRNLAYELLWSQS